MLPEKAPAQLKTTIRRAMEGHAKGHTLTFVSSSQTVINGGSTLVKLGFLEAGVLARALSNQAKVPGCDLFAVRTFRAV